MGVGSVQDAMRDGCATVECPGCGTRFDDWWRPCAELDCDPELADPGYLDCAATATCPRCGDEIRLGVIAATPGGPH
jgi:hypothetical protein